MPKIPINDTELFYGIHGAGEPVLLIAGFSSDISTWAVMMPVLARQYQVIRFDNRGVGRSAACDRPVTIPQLAADAVALLDALELSQVHIIGHSMGGQIAQEIALTAPDRVRSLTLIATLARGDRKFRSLIEVWGDLALQVDSITFQKQLLPWIFSAAFYESELIDGLLESIQHYPCLPTPHALYHQSRAILEYDSCDRLAQISQSTLVVVTREDAVTPVRFSEQLAQHITKAQLVVLEQGGHGCVVEVADALTNVIIPFLTQVGQVQNELWDAGF